ncbi:MAG: HEAT repeat domain-containing protein [Verrucomicrobiales bacterium]|nr:HEAT repeat domain-containing protein [Verrucomicrobiales bacterium]
MKILIFTLSYLILSLALSADELDDKLLLAEKFVDGNPSEPLKFIESKAVESLNDPQLRDSLEEKILSSLGTANSRRGKDFLCRMLRIMGTKKSIPLMKELLSDQESGHMARYVLASMQYKEAGAALHQSLNTVQDKLRQGIIDSLGDIRYKKAIPDLIELLDTASVANNATRALGLIGGDSTMNHLLPRLSKTTGKSYRCTVQALLRCAEIYLEKGNKEKALSIYDRFTKSGTDSYVILAGLRGASQVNGEFAVPLLTEAIKSGNNELANGAASIIAELKGDNIGSKLKSLLESAPANMQILLIGSLSEREDKSAIPSIIKLTESESLEVRLSAIQALGKIGNGSSVIPLATIASSTSGHERNVSRSALSNLKGNDVQNAYKKYIKESLPEIQSELVRAIATRAESTAMNELMILAKSDTPEIREEALRGIGILADQSHLNEILMLLLNPKEESDRDNIESAIAYSFRRIPNKILQTDALTKALKKADENTKPSIISLLGRDPNKQSLQLLISALKETTSIQLAAIEALTKWPNHGPANDLLKIASEEKNPNKDTALNGYIILSSKSPNPTTDYRKALELNNSTDTAKKVLAGLGQSGGIQSLEIIRPYLENSETSNEAALAATQVAKRIKDSHTATVRTILTDILKSNASDSAKKGAADLQSELDLYKDYILDWRITGPYSVKGKDAKYVFDTALAPEKDSKSVRWKKFKTKSKSERSLWAIEIDSILGPEANAAAYAMTKIWAPENLEINLEMGSDDHIRVWLNDKKIHDSFSNRSLEPRQSIIPVSLSKGWNLIMLKVVNTSGPWGLCCRIRGRDGNPVDGLKIESK